MERPNFWFKQSVRALQANLVSSSEWEPLSCALDQKYGTYQYAEDLRTKYQKPFDDAVGLFLHKYVPKGKRIVLAGANQGVEMPLLNDYSVTGVDLSRKALGLLREKHPSVKTVHGNIEDLPFVDDSFDAYVALRTLTSSNVHLEKALAESVRVSPTFVLYSIPNGYFIDGSIRKGMYDTASASFDGLKPYAYARSIETWLETRGFVTERLEVPSEILIAGRKMNKVLKSTKYVVDHSTEVSLNEEAIDEFVNGFVATSARHWLTESPVDLTLFTARERLNFLVVFNAISFSYWGKPKWKVEYHGKILDGSWAMIAVIARACEEGLPILDFEYLSRISKKDFAYIMRGNVTIPLSDERWGILRNIGSTLVTKYQSSFSYFLERHGRDINVLRDAIAKTFPALNDVAVYKGHKVFFHKRAQLLLSDISHLCEEGRDLDRLYDLTACADYKLPQILRKLGILAFSESLASLIDSETELARQSEVEVEIRANTIWAVEIIRRRLFERGFDVSATDINDHLWLLTQQKADDDKPYFRVRTIAY